MKCSCPSLRPGRVHVSRGDPRRAPAPKQSPSLARTTGVSALLAEAPPARVRAAPADGDLVAMTLQGQLGSVRYARGAIRPRRLPSGLPHAARRRGGPRRDAGGLLQSLSQPADVQGGSEVFDLDLRDRLSCLLRPAQSPQALRKRRASRSCRCRARARSIKSIALDEASAACARAIDALPEKYRTVITLFHLQGKQYEEIANVLGLPMGTVKTHLFRAKEQLRRLLGRNGGNGIMTMTTRRRGLDRALSALPLEEPPEGLRASI